MNLERFIELMREDKCVATERVQLEWIEPLEAPCSQAQVFRLIFWQVQPDGQKSISNVLEQAIRMDDFWVPHPEDVVRTLLQGWRRALWTLFSLAEQNRLEALFPHELIRPEVARLKSPRSSEDYAKAFLAPSRLGSLIVPLEGVVIEGLIRDTIKELWRGDADALVEAAQKRLVSGGSLHAIVDAIIDAMGLKMLMEERIDEESVRYTFREVAARFLSARADKARHLPLSSSGA